VRLAYDLYDPVIKFSNGEGLKRNMDLFIEKQGSRLGENPSSFLSSDKQYLLSEFNQCRLKMATASISKRPKLFTNQ
jgi:hypothetical protein